ncbi:MAG: hypothetical protein ACI4TK_11285, partial [Agathobacter sp.]
QRIKNAYSSECVEQIKSRHAFLHGHTDGTSEYAYLWSKDEDTSWGHNFGRMRGYEDIWNGNVMTYDRLTMQNWMEMVSIYPETMGKDPRPLMEASVHTLATDIIEVADDGMSARAGFITPGVIHSVLTPEQEKYCIILWERYGSDFVCEEGQWLYIHEQVCPDIQSNLDEIDWARRDYLDLKEPDPNTEEIPLFPTLPHVTEPGPLHFVYSCLQPVQNTVPYPEPYETMDEEHRYAPYRTDL